MCSYYSRDGAVHWRLFSLNCQFISTNFDRNINNKKYMLHLKRQTNAMSGYKRVNFYELCRLCASNQQKEKTHIFQEEGRKIQLQSKIQICLSLTVGFIHCLSRLYGSESARVWFFLGVRERFPAKSGLFAVSAKFRRMLRIS